MSTFRLLALITSISILAGSANADDLPPASTVSAEIDRLIDAEITASGGKPAPQTSDNDFLRRVTLDLADRLPSPADTTLFELNPDSHKRSLLITELLGSSNFSAAQSRYWRDVIFSRATDTRSRLMVSSFQTWMTEQFEQRRGWDEIVESMLTAKGDVRENGATALLFAQGGEAAELAAETSRIFLGIQIQCANCHDHPTDRWKRIQFHQLAAFFPRVRVRPVRDSTPRTFEVVSLDRSPRANRRPSSSSRFIGAIYQKYDRNRDGKLVATEVTNSRLAQNFKRMLERGDTNKDGGLSLAEFKKIPPPGNANRRTDTEHFMPNLDEPNNRGDAIRPVFFATGGRASEGLEDTKRRQLLANHVTSKSNPWFTRAYVNRTWSVLLGQGFSMPIDDMGPEREVTHPQVFERLCKDFAESNYNTRRLFEVITGTQAYQRQIRHRDANDSTPPFAAAEPSRLRADQIYNSLVGILGGATVSGGRRTLRGGQSQSMMSRRRSSGRTLFLTLFGFDPSTPQEDITGNVPQALFLMNSPMIHTMVRSRGNTRLARILQKHSKNDEAVAEVYLLVLSREPSASELAICRDYLAKVGDRGEAFEDLMWSLINSSEFLSRR
ncbi:MAG: DUF1549 domain-containing protein [Planctomycetota bacterium]|nr:DUF1549 domain-containing protein [Planctomycetota bacterium]